MIKNFESFVNDSNTVNGGETVNEGFLDNVMSGIEAGIGAFKANRNAEKAADEELSDILNGRSGEFSNKVKMTALVKQLVERSAMLADGFSYDKIMEDGEANESYELDLMLVRMEKIDEIISGLKALMTEDFGVKF
jgi:hypothetical protein